MQDRVHPRFTDREQTILLLVADGMSNREIAEQLTLSPTTVKWYVKQIFNKLGANRRTQAVKMASDLNLLDITTGHKHDLTPGIPAPLTPLIGREKEIDEIIDLLNQPMVRLVTILGVGGVGKTRLAREVARLQAGQMPGQVSFVALDSVTSLSGLIQAVASTIGLQFHGSLDISRQLLMNLRNRKLLLFLDNFEHLLEATPFIKEMLTAAPRLQILATSRIRLGVKTETIYSLQGLAFPSTTKGAREYAAFMLFIQVAHYSQPSFPPDSDDVAHICRICKLVEGMPLAIELSAKWIDILTPAQISDEIVRGIDILKTTRTDLPERHRSMAAVFERSWQLLSDEERDVFKKLCVFRGGFDRMAAEQITGATLFMLSTLVDKSLLMRVGRDRFKLHELVLQFAQEKLQLDKDKYTLTLDKHCQYYAGLMEGCENEFKSDVSAIPNILLKVQNDHDNIHAAWHYALNHHINEIQKYVFIISFFFQTHGLNAEARQTFALALDLLDASNSVSNTLARVRVMTHYGWFLQVRNQLDLACRVLQDALEFTIMLDSSHQADVGLLMGFLATALSANNQLEEARENVQKGLVTCQAIKFQFGVCMCFSILGEIDHIQGHYEMAYYYHHQALILAEKDANLFHTIQSLTLLGCCCCALGNVEDAIGYLQRGLTLMRTFSFIDPLFLTILGIAGIHEQRGRFEIALELLAILQHHPQYGSAVQRATVRVLVAQLQSHLSAESISIVMEKAKQGQLSRRYLDPQFTISPELVDRLSELLEEAAI